MKPHRSIFIMYQWQLIDPSSSYQWQLIDPSSSMQSHQGKCILYYINQSIIWHQSITWHQSMTSINQTICINDTWSNNLPNNQTIGINDNMIQQSPPLALMAIPTLMSTPITNYWCQHVDMACSTSIVNVTISPHQSLPINQHQSHQCDYLLYYTVVWSHHENTSMWLSLPLWHQWQRAILLLGLLPLLELSLGMLPLSKFLWNSSE